MSGQGLYWLQPCEKWSACLRDLRERGARSEREWWSDIVDFARHDLEALATDRLASLRRRAFPVAPPSGIGTQPVRVALLGSVTLSQLEGGIVAGGLRRGLWIDTYAAPYGQYLQEIMDPRSALAAFAPTHILLVFDARAATAGLSQGDAGDTALAEFIDHVRMCWTHARTQFPDVTILQQTVLPILPRILGSNERRHGGSPAALIDRINAALADLAEAGMVDLVDPASVSAGRDPAFWYDPVLWFKARQEVTPIAAPLYGDIVARVVAAGQGRSAKCLVLDLDDTIWGGVIGDDGIEGIVLGQGSPGGEAFLAVQDYARALSRRGVILAVCSKNDEATALLPFENHPDMLLRRADISAFVANWNDKATNLRAIASMLDIGLDALVFVDDNPFERDQVRSALPMVAVPELPEDPALVAFCLADAGYFEAISVTADDLARRAHYAGNAERERLRSDASDISAYLASLGMRMSWQPFRPLDHERTVQLINKTNQFNLTTRRYSSAEVAAVADDPDAIGLTFRLLDRFGDNGIIAVLIARIDDARREAAIDTWLMSCRVLGRGVEAAMLGVLARCVGARGATSLVGEFIATEKNAIVRDHYAKLGFTLLDRDGTLGIRSRLAISDFSPPTHLIAIEEPMI